MIKCYYSSDADDLVLELWGGSTKHPDSRFWFNDFKKTPFIEPEFQVFQWILECASKLTWPIHARQLATFAEILDDKIKKEGLTWDLLKQELNS